MEYIQLEDLTPRVLAGSDNPNCVDCTDLRTFGAEVLEALPAREDIEASVLVGRFVSLSSLCTREVPVPPANCDEGPCSLKQDTRKCLLKELLGMSPSERLVKIQEIADL